MKVYVKNQNRQSLISYLFLMITFLGLSIYILFDAFEYNNPFDVFEYNKPIIDILYSSIVSIIISIEFFIFSMWAMWMLIKKPKCYKSKLVSKKFEVYNETQITYMKFKISEENEKEFSLFECYTIGGNDLTIGNEYLLKIKQFNWKPKFVQDINTLSEKEKNKISNTLFEYNIWPLIFSIELILAGCLFHCILGITIYNEDMLSYIILIVSIVLIMIIIFAMYIKYKNDDSIDLEEDLEEDDYLDLEVEAVKNMDNDLKNMDKD